MFTTFSASASHSDQRESLQARPKASSVLRARRQQVGRACGWCRTYRIKCDDQIPCRNCAAKGRQCVDKGVNELRTFSLAVKEIGQLKSRVKDLEVLLNAFHCSTDNCTQTPSLPENLDPLREHGGNRGSWEYFYLKLPGSDQVQCYGPASPFYFMGSINSHLKTVLTATDLPAPLEGATNDDSSARPGDTARKERTTPRRTNSTGKTPLSRWQEEQFLDLFWGSFHCIYPLLDEAEFRAHHNSIWIMPYEPRKPSALVDIILAMTMQYDAALASPELTNSTLSSGKDAEVAGRMYYRRCHSLIGEELENPSIVTLQCHIFSAIYLLNAGSYNSAHSTLAIACRVAVILGLHREPPSDDKNNFHRRLWWTLYALEIRAAMAFGRPLAVSFSEVTCGLPKDAAPHTGQVLMPGSPTSQVIDLRFKANSQFIKLILAARSVYVTFYGKSADVLYRSQQNTLYGNPRALESCAEFLASKMQYLWTWLGDLPDSLKMKRRDGGKPFSVDGSPLDIQPLLPFSQQKQQLFLELHYHTAAMNLLRHFINFSQNPSSSTPITQANADSCVDHAITITNIIHQMLTETNLLDGWLETFQWGSNAFLSLVGYVLAYPSGQRTSEARGAMQKATSVFNLLSRNLDIAVTGAYLARDFTAKVDMILDRSCPRSSMQLDTTDLPRIADALLDSNASETYPTQSWPDPVPIFGMEVSSSDTWSQGLIDSTYVPDTQDWATINGGHISDIWAFDPTFEVNRLGFWTVDGPPSGA